MVSDYLQADPLFKRIYHYTRERFEAAPHLTAHNFEHAQRDVLNAITIGEAEGADMNIVLPAMVMHDIGFLYGATGSTHGAVGAEKLAEFLAEGNIQVSAPMLAAMASCIRTHKGSAHGESPESLEAKVVSDADMIDKMGPIGAYQMIRVFGEFKLDAAGVILRLKQSDGIRKLTTATGTKLAQERTGFVADFAKALDEAYKPYREEQA